MFFRKRLPNKKSFKNLNTSVLFVIIKMNVINSLIIGGGCMPKTTLQVIQAIEDEARKIKLIYDEKIAESRLEIEDKLAEDEVIFDHETEVMLSNLREKQEQELNEAELKLNRTIETNKQKREQALTNRKNDLVQQIVQEVVSRYGD